MEITLEKHLEFFGNICEEYRKLNATWISAKDAISKILENIILCFPHYSMHDDSHAQSIIRNVERMLGRRRIEKMTPTDTWLFLMSAYSHDIGMIITDEELKRTWKSKEFSEFLKNINENPKLEDLREYTKYFTGKIDRLMPDDWPIHEKWATIILSAEYFRSQHAEKSKSYITSLNDCRNPFKIDFSFNGFIPNRLISLLGDLAAYHARNFDEIFTLDYRANGIGLADDYIHPRFLAEMLRLGDLLDLDNGRFNENVFSLCGRLPKATLANQLKHEAVKHYLIRDNCIEVTGDCKDESSYEALSQWCRWLDAEIRNLSLHWNEIVPPGFGAAFSLPKIRILLKGKSLQKDALMRFDFKNEDIFSLLEGAHIYRNKYAFFRELLQNAMDATKLRLWKLICDGTYDGLIEKKESISKYLPSDISPTIYEGLSISLDIRYEKESDSFEISLMDHGIGINENSIQNMSCVGKSWKDRTEWKNIIADMPAWLRPTGGFGLGLQSVFHVTNVMECITKPMDESPKRITFRSKDKGGYITCESIELPCDYPVGTKFTFSILRAETKRYSYHLGGSFHDYIRSYDPFQRTYDENSPDTIFSYFWECICTDIYKGLFPIKIQFIDGDYKSEAMIPCQTWDKVKRGTKVLSNGKLVYTDYVNAAFSVYDTQNDIFIKASFLINRQPHSSKLYFKGVALNEALTWGNSYQKYDEYLQIYVDLEGFNAVDMLTLDRQKILSEKRHYVLSLLVENLKSGMDEFYSHFLENKTDIQKSGNRMTAILGLHETAYGINCEKSKDMHSFFINFFEKNALHVEIYTKNESGVFERKKESLHKILSDVWTRKEFYLLREDNGYNIYSENFDPLKGLNQIDDDITHDVLLQKSGILSLLQVSFVREVYAGEVDHQTFFLLHCSIEEGEGMVEKLNEMAKRIFFEKLLSAPRFVINAVKTYEKLAVTSVPIELAVTRRYEMVPFNSDFYLISPFNKDDIENIKNGTTDNLWTTISTRSDFSHLKAYVKNKNVSSIVTDVEIIEEYKKLVLAIIEFSQQNLHKCS